MPLAAGKAELSYLVRCQAAKSGRRAIPPGIEDRRSSRVERHRNEALELWIGSRGASIGRAWPARIEPCTGTGRGEDGDEDEPEEGTPRARPMTAVGSGEHDFDDTAEAPIRPSSGRRLAL